MCHCVTRVISGVYYNVELKATQGLLVTDPLGLNHGQVTRATHGRNLGLIFPPSQHEDFEQQRFNVHQPFHPVVLQWYQNSNPRNDNTGHDSVTTRLPQPICVIQGRNYAESAI
ncbi:hypothetical protein TNCV_4814791 [Trichonephila clavipes]|nr:hypothetical protein TNCV_4814791 [Trichonephila clavipes]